MNTRYQIRELELTTVQQRVLAALTQGATINAAAEANGVHRTTIYRWARQYNAFQRAIERARQVHGETVHDELRGLSREAIDTLRELLRSPDSPASVRLRAAVSIIEATGSALTEPVSDALAADVQIQGAVAKMSDHDLDAAAEPAQLRPRATCATASQNSAPAESAA